MWTTAAEVLDLALGFRVYVDRMRISELADHAGVNVSTVRFYERIGLVPDPQRSDSGYRAYDEQHQSRLLLITRARRLGLSIDQITELLGIWDGSNCSATRAEMTRSIDSNLIDIRGRIAELETFAVELERTRSALVTDGPASCTPDLSCCAPATTGRVPVSLLERRA